MNAALIAGGALLGQCAAQPLRTVTLAAQQASILVRSRPAAGATVSGPVDVLMFRFSSPARLEDVTLDGPDGLMPMMVHSVGESTDYSIPLSRLRAGAYRVNWKATTQAKAYQGSFGFTVK